MADRMSKVSKIVNLGAGTYVLASEIVAVDVAMSGLVFTMLNETHPTSESVVLLKNGALIPSMYKPETVKKRWQEALE